MRTGKLILIILILAIAMMGCQNIEKVETPEGKSVDGIEVIGRVNDEYILKSDYDRQVTQAKSALEANGQNFSTSEGKKILKEVKEIVLESLVTDQLILQQAANKGIKLKESDFKEAISELEELYGGKDGDRGALETYLKQQGISWETFEAEVRNQLIINQLKEELTAHVKVNDKEIKEYYDENKATFELPTPEIRVSHILVDTENKAKEILAEIKNKADFVDLAKKYSIDLDSKDLGGDLGYYAKGTIPPEFEDVAFALKPGEISDIIKTEDGYHIIKVTDERTSIGFEDAKTLIAKNLKNAKKDEEFSKHLDKWRKQATIEKYL